LDLRNGTQLFRQRARKEFSSEIIRCLFSTATVKHAQRARQHTVRARAQYSNYFARLRIIIIIMLFAFRRNMFTVFKAFDDVYIYIYILHLIYLRFLPIFAEIKACGTKELELSSSFCGSRVDLYRRKTCDIISSRTSQRVPINLADLYDNIYYATLKTTRTDIPRIITF